MALCVTAHVNLAGAVIGDRSNDFTAAPENLDRIVTKGIAMLQARYFSVWKACVLIIFAGVATVGRANDQHAMGFMQGHMYLTALRPAQAGDAQKAAAVVAAARLAMAPYVDYHRALDDGYQIFLPDVPQAQYHFTRYDYGLAARSQFDPARPTSLLYKKLADGGYQLVGGDVHGSRGCHRR